MPKALLNPEKVADKPKGHEKYSNDDIDKCPVMQIRAKQADKENEKQQIALKNADIENPKKVKMPKGGCPFMPSDKKKNPMLGKMDYGYDMAFISPYEHFFQMTPLLDIALMNKPSAPKERKVFESYPIYLKHSLMIDDDENMKQIREMEISKRFFCYDRFREKGNKLYYKEDYETALQFYERAYHCFRWLSYKTPKDDSDSDSENNDNEVNKEGEKDINNENENNNNIEEINEERKDSDNMKNENQQQPQKSDKKKSLKERLLNSLSKKEKQLFGQNDLSEKEEKEIQEYMDQMKKQKKDFKNKYKNLMKTYNDETVVYHDGEEVTDQQEIEMRQSMLHTILMLIGVVYIKLKHYKLALQAFEESIVIHKSTQIQYRKSQAITCNNWSTLEELQEAQKMIEEAIEMKKYEKIFIESQPGILKIMNLHNHEEAYRDQAIAAVSRIHDRKQFETEKIREVMKREKRYQEIVAQMIADGKSPQDRDVIEQIDEFEDSLEMMVVHEMVKKYYKAIEFYTETKKPEQVAAAKFQLQLLLETVQEMVYFWEIDWKCWAAEEVNKEFKFDLSNPVMIRRLDKIKKKRAKEIFDSAKNFNFEIFKWALDDVMTIKRKRDKQLEEEEKLKRKQDKMGPGSMAGLVINHTLKSPSFYFVLSFTMLMFILSYVLMGSNGQDHLENVLKLLKFGGVNLESK